MLLNSVHISSFMMIIKTSFEEEMKKVFDFFGSRINDGIKYRSAAYGRRVAMERVKRMKKLMMSSSIH